jgi:hypothetical protein
LLPFGYTDFMSPLPKYLTQDEFKRFFAAIDSPRDKALFGLIYHYGLRVGEALMICSPTTGPRDRLESAPQQEDPSAGQPVVGGADAPALATGRA